MLLFHLANDDNVKQLIIDDKKQMELVKKLQLDLDRMRRVSRGNTVEQHSADVPGISVNLEVIRCGARENKFSTNIKKRSTR